MQENGFANQELDAIKEWCLTILNFYYSKPEKFDNWMKMESILLELINIIRTVKYLDILKMMLKDINTLPMHPDYSWGFEELNKILLERFGREI
jgi:hypothetical protein